MYVWFDSFPFSVMSMYKTLTYAERHQMELQFHRLRNEGKLMKCV